VSKLVAITGGESYIAAELKSVFKSRGINFVGLDLVAKKDPTTVIADITSDEFSDFVPANCDALIHLAALSRDKDCKANPSLAMRVNLEGTQRVIDACVKRGVKQLIFASTEWVYGEVEEGGVQKEDQILTLEKTQNVYAASKLTGEQLCRLANKEHSLPITILRFGIVYGPRSVNEREFSSAVESLFYQVQDGKDIQVGSLETGRRFIHVRDLCTGIFSAIGRSDFEIFNISGDRVVSLGEVIDASFKVLNKSVQVSQTNPSNKSTRNPDNTRAKKSLKWKPEMDLFSGLSTLRES